jgi:hypothetical protein
MLEKVLGGIASWHWPFLAAKPSHVRIDVDVLAYPLNRTMIHSYPMRGHGLVSRTALSYRAVGGSGVFSG